MTFNPAQAPNRRSTASCTLAVGILRGALGVLLNDLPTSYVLSIT